MSFSVFWSGIQQFGCTYTRPELFAVSGALPLQLGNPPRLIFGYVDTEGREAIVRTSVNGGASQGDTITPSGSGARWYVKVR